MKPYGSFIPAEYELCCKKIKGHDEFYINNKYIREWFENEDLSGLKHPNTEKQILSLPVLNQALQNWILSIKCVYKNVGVLFECDNKKAIGYDKSKGTYIGINTKNLKILSDKILGLKKLYWRNGKLDHNDILYFSFVLIDKYPFIVDVLRAKFAYMFIDEYQDTNPVQSFILDEIRKKETVIGVIGDKAQSIYKFQGADPLLFNSFKVNKNNVYTICENHRSSNQIIKLLNSIRGDIEQIPCEDINDIEVVIYIGDQNIAYKKACELCGKEAVISLSRDNINSNAMKKEIEENNLNRKLLELYSEQDSNSERRNNIVAFIQAIELAVNSKYKEAIKSIEWIFRKENNPKKIALSSLAKMLKNYEDYHNDTLIKFYDVICLTLNVNLSGFRKGAAKNFYENTLYKSLAICINITEDTSNHITVHKSKGSEFENVLLIGNKDMLELLITPDLLNNEEHRIIYVAMSRAKRKLFLQLKELDVNDEKKLKEKYTYLDIQRI